MQLSREFLDNYFDFEIVGSNDFAGEFKIEFKMNGRSFVTNWDMRKSLITIEEHIKRREPKDPDDIFDIIGCWGTEEVDRFKFIMSEDHYNGRKSPYEDIKIDEIPIDKRKKAMRFVLERTVKHIGMELECMILTQELE